MTSKPDPEVNERHQQEYAQLLSRLLVIQHSLMLLHKVATQALAVFQAETDALIQRYGLPSSPPWTAPPRSPP